MSRRDLHEILVVLGMGSVFVISGGAKQTIDADFFLLIEENHRRMPRDSESTRPSLPQELDHYGERWDENIDFLRN